MWITDLFVDSPCKPICLCYCWLLVCLFISGAAQFMVPALGGDRDYGLWMDDEQVSYDIYSLATEEISEKVGA